MRVIQTEASTRFVGTASFAAITGAPVLITEWEPDALRGAFPGDPAPEHAPLSHLALVERADLFLIAPASANTIAKLAHGARRQPADHRRARVPAAADRRAGDERRDVRARGDAARTSRRCASAASRCSSPAPARSARRASGASAGCPSRPSCWPPSRRASARSRGGSLDGLKVLVTAGGTREPIDAVRFVGNRSSGQMGWALAEEAAAPRRRGHGRRGQRRAAARARRSSTSTSRPPPSSAPPARERFPSADVLLMAAAVADYRPASARADKIKKAEAGETLALELERTDDVLSGLAAQRRPGQMLIGFAAESGDGAVAYARDKLERKGLDAVVVNDVSRAGIAFDAPDNEVTIVTAEGEQHVPQASKAAIAGAILDSVLSRRSSSARKGSELMEPVEPQPSGTLAPAEVQKAAAVARRIEENIKSAVKVRDEVLEHVVVAMLAEGHILVEDYPGVGKTALARALSRSIDSQFARIQCTADLLPADIVGTNVYNQREQRFEFRPGPIFANIVIVDEVNRASPKTQSGLLECMQERMVTVDVHSHELARPFLVFATQNPVEYEGTYPLPEAQVDRFMVRLELGYPSAAEEAGMLAGHESGDRVLDLQPVADRAEVLESPGRRAPRARLQGAARVHRRAAAPHPRRPPRRARRLAARRPDAAARRQGARAAAGPRPRAARRRPGARAGRPPAPHHARARSRGHPALRDRRRRDRGDAGALRARPCAPPSGARRSASCS